MKIKENMYEDEDDDPGCENARTFICFCFLGCKFRFDFQLLLGATIGRS